MMNRSEELQSLSKNEVEDEKLALQKALLYFENIHGRPVTKDEKGGLLYYELMKSENSTLLGSCSASQN